MAQQTIDSIRAAELKAREIAQEAEQNKKTLIEKAKKDSAEETLARVNEASAKAKAQVAEVESKLEGELKAAEERANAVISQFEANAAAHRDEAIQLVVSEIA
ncbi:MAG: hypothetical protein HUJ75_00330 [Parasporobacterium sp.]|nr:hypothetical protein [Parasporobacterium sp.]